MSRFDALSPLFGIETADIDVSQPLSDATFVDLARTFYAPR